MKGHQTGGDYRPRTRPTTFQSGPSATGTPPTTLTSITDFSELTGLKREVRHLTYNNVPQSFTKSLALLGLLIKRLAS